MSIPNGTFSHTNVMKFKFNHTQGKKNGATVCQSSIFCRHTEQAIYKHHQRVKRCTMQRRKTFALKLVSFTHHFLPFRNKNKVNPKFSYLYIIPAKSNIRRAAVISVVS